jgi:ABC-type polysaccharide/polyol phosphate export permease
MVDGAAAWRLWTLLARRDIRQRYRRSLLGPFWLTLSMAVMIAALAIVYGTLFGMVLQEYLPYLTLGLIVWGFISGLVGDGCGCFIESETFLRQARLPRTLFVLRAICRNLLLLAHNLVVYVVVAAWFKVPLGLWSLAALPGLALICLAGVGLGLLLGLSSARFRDVPQITASVLQVFFFITPILFTSAMLGPYAWLAEYNPATHLLAIVREPLVGRAPSLENWAFALATAAVLLAAGFVMLVRTRARLSYWL